MSQFASGGDRRRRVLMVLPYDMSSRNTIRAPLAGLLAADDSLDVTMVSRDAKDAQLLAQLPGRTIAWEPVLRPLRGLPQGWARGLAGWRHLLADIRFILGFYLHLTLVFRFNHLAGFRGFRDRLRQSLAMRRIAFREGLPSMPWLGWPFPGCRHLFVILRRLYYSFWQRHVAIEALFDRLQPDLLVLTHLQSPMVTPYLLAARARGIRIIGLNGSWDQPTTKGPLVAGIDSILVQSRQVQDDLVRFHHFPAERIKVVGWPQMDVYGDARVQVERADFLARLGLPMNQRYVLVGAYAQRLGCHEPEMCRQLAGRLRSGEFGEHVTLYIRSHPLDLQWQDRLGALHDPPHVVVEPPQLGALDYLANLLRHAEVVIASAGTINLDAVAVGTPSIAVAFEEDGVPYYDRPVRRYDMEHYAAIVATGGVRLVRSQQELEEAVQAYMHKRDLDSTARQRLRDDHLAPLDGCASARIAACIAEAAR